LSGERKTCEDGVGLTFKKNNRGQLGLFSLLGKFQERRIDVIRMGGGRAVILTHRFTSSNAMEVNIKYDKKNLKTEYCHMGERLIFLS